MGLTVFEAVACFECIYDFVSGLTLSHAGPHVASGPQVGHPCSVSDTPRPRPRHLWAGLLRSWTGEVWLLVGSQ